MRKGYLFGCALMMVAATAQMKAQDQIVALDDLNERMAQVFTQGKMAGVILECKAGTSLPLQMTFKGSFLSLSSWSASPTTLTLLKTCYVQCVEPEHFLFSTDMQNWKEISEFFTGELKLSIDGTNGANLQLVLDERGS